MTELLKAEFSALIKMISSKSLVCGDKEAEIKLRFMPTDDLMDKLNRLHRADDEVQIIVAER